MMKKHNNNLEHKSYLLSKGWKFKEVDGTWLWLSPNEDIWRLNTTPIAYEIQREWDIIDRIGKCYFAVRNPYGYGWDVKVFTDKQKKNCVRVDKFSSVSEHSAKGFVDDLNSGEPEENFKTPEPIRYNLIAKFTENHAERYFIVPTYSDLCKVCLKVVLERDEEGCWYYIDEHELETPSLTKEQLEKMPDGCVKDAAKEEWRYYERQLEELKESKKLQEALEKIRTSKDGELAVRFLMERKDYEHERFEIIDAEDYE